MKKLFILMLLGIMLSIAVSARNENVGCLNATDFKEDGELELDEMSDSRLVEIIDSSVRRGSWLEKAIKKAPWHPVWYDMFIDYDPSKADSIVERCEEILTNHYGCLDSIANKDRLEGISEVVSSDSCFTFLDIFKDLVWVKPIGYGVIYCNNPIPVINWYKNHKSKIKRRIYRMMTIFTGPYVGFRLDSADMEKELYFTDKENIRIAMFLKRLDVRAELQALVEQDADSSTIEKAINFVLYEEPFDDIRAEIENIPEEKMPRKKYSSF